MVEIVTNLKGSDGKTDVRTFTSEVALGANLDETLAMFGAETVFDHFIASATIQYQAAVRTLMRPTKKRAAMTDAEIARELATWKPTRRAGADPEKKIANVVKTVNTLSPAQRAALMAQLLAADGEAAEENGETEAGAEAEANYEAEPEKPAPVDPAIVRKGPTTRRGARA